MNDYEVLMGIMGETLWGFGTWHDEEASHLDVDYWYGCWTSKSLKLGEVNASLDSRSGRVSVWGTSDDDRPLDCYVELSLGDPDIVVKVREAVKAGLREMLGVEL
jgi:hypothetical protein